MARDSSEGEAYLSVSEGVDGEWVGGNETNETKDKSPSRERAEGRGDDDGREG